MSKTGSKERAKPAPARSQKNVVRLNQLLRTMLGVISAQKTVPGVSREIAKQIALAVRGEWALVCGWDLQTNTLSLWGEYKESRAQKPADFISRKHSRAGPELTRILGHREPVQLPTTSKAGRELSQLLTLPKRGESLLFIPIRHTSQQVGLVVVFSSDRDRKFSEAERIVSQIFANHAAVILENVQLQANAQRRAAEIEGLRKASLELGSTLELREIVSVALRNAQRMLPDVKHARIYFLEHENLHPAGSLSAPGQHIELFHDPRPEGWLTQVVGNGESLYLGTQNRPSRRSRRVNRRDLVIITMTLQVGDRVLGLIDIVYSSPLHLDEELRITRLLADQTATAIENARLHAQAQLEALTDVLTGLPNRRSFDQRLQEELRRAARYKHNFSLVMIDLDHFKRINDHYGHRIGDIALQEVARCLRNKVRDTDFLARFGGDEFVLILPETSREDARSVCAKLHESMTECAVGWGGVQALSFSYGIAEFPQDAGEAATLVTAADKAMYGEKGKSEVPAPGA